MALSSAESAPQPDWHIPRQIQLDLPHCDVICCITIRYAGEGILAAAVGHRPHQRPSHLLLKRRTWPNGNTCRDLLWVPLLVVMALPAQKLEVPSNRGC